MLTLLRWAVEITPSDLSKWLQGSEIKYLDSYLLHFYLLGIFFPFALYFFHLFSESVSSPLGAQYFHPINGGRGRGERTYDIHILLVLKMHRGEDTNWNKIHIF